MVDMILNGCVRHTHNICMVSDFFYPNTGGVESHIFQLSQCLIQRGHKVIVITHEYDNRKGVRYMTNGLKVYYLPFRAFYNQCIFPSGFITAPLVRSVLIRENITIVHGHSSFSALAHESMLHARNLGLKTVFTDHSLFGFADASAIITNKFLELSLLECDSVICVSHVSKENTVLRAKLDPSLVYVIPNAVDSHMFTPDVTQRNPNRVNVIVVSRLVYRKGTDLLVGVIPKICEKYPEVNFIIAGEGPKRTELEEMIEKQELFQRVQLLGPVEHSGVRDVLNQGHLFLNTSLTEAYCMAIVEAASCGLQVVTTDVGGIPEVLPSEWTDDPGKLAWLTKPNVESLVQGLENALCDFRSGSVVNPSAAHTWVRDTYNWQDVVKRTERVYNTISYKRSKSLGERLTRYINGSLGQKLYTLVIAIDYLVIQVANWFLPEDRIDLVPRYLPNS